jgi:hypothetical protein
VQSVQNDSLTGGYKSKFLFFHKLFLKGVENFTGDFSEFRKKAAIKKPPIKAASLTN